MSRRSAAVSAKRGNEGSSAGHIFIEIQRRTEGNLRPGSWGAANGPRRRALLHEEWASPHYFRRPRQDRDRGLRDSHRSQERSRPEGAQGITDHRSYQYLLQTDVDRNPTNSGGLVHNLHGQGTGMNTAISSQLDGPEGIGFAVPGQ